MSRRQFLEGMRKEARGRCDSLFDGTPLRTPGEDDTSVNDSDRPAPNGHTNTSVVEEDELSNSRLHGADNGPLENSAYCAVDSPPPNEASIFSDKPNDSGIALSYEDDKEASSTLAPPPGDRLRSKTIAYPSDVTLESANKEAGGSSTTTGANGSRAVEEVNQVIEEAVGEEPPAQVYTARPNRPPLPLFSANMYSAAPTTTTTTTTTVPAATEPTHETVGTTDFAPKVDVSTTLELENNGSERTSGLRDDSTDIVRIHAERSPSDPRHKESSATRMENDLLELQVALATEKRNNIDAEKRMQALKREVDVLKKENMSLASSMNNVHASSSSLNSSQNNVKVSGPPAGGVSARYVEELESRVAKLTRQLEEKKSELEAKDERIRLLEHKLVESVLTHEVSPARTYGEQTSTSRPASPGLVRINSTHTTDLKTLEQPTPAPSAMPTGASLVHNLKTGSQDRPASSVRRRNSPEMISPRRRRTVPTTAVGTQPRASTAGVVDATTRPVTTTPGRSTPLRQHSVQRSGSLTSGPSKVRPASARRRDSNASMLSEPSTASATKRKTSTAGAATATKPSSARRASRKGSTSSLLSAPKEKEVRRSSTRNSVSPAHPMHLLDGQGAPSLSQQRAMVGTTLPQRPSIAASSSYAHVSPARSQSPSMRSGTNTRSRPQITYNAKDDTTTMKGTTTTVVFRSRSPQEARAPLLPEETRRTSERGEEHFVSEKFSTTTYRPNRAVDVSREEL